MVFDILELGLKLIDKVVPDPVQKQAAQLELLKLKQDGEFRAMENDLKVDLAQIEVNKIEAGSGSFFRGGWRPATGWVCVIGLTYQFLGHPLLVWLSGVQGWPAPPPLETFDLLTLLGGLLGLGTMRHREKLVGKG